MGATEKNILANLNAGSSEHSKAALDRLAVQDFPTRKTEAWKYTRVAKLVNAEGQTRTLWKNTFGQNVAKEDRDFAQPGAMFRGEPPNGKLLLIDDEVQRNILKAEQQNNHGAVISGYRLLYEMIIKPKEHQGKRTWRNYKGSF